MSPVRRVLDARAHRRIAGGSAHRVGPAESGRQGGAGLLRAARRANTSRWSGIERPSEGARGAAAVPARRAPGHAGTADAPARVSTRPMRARTSAIPALATLFRPGRAAGAALAGPGPAEAGGRSGGGLRLQSTGRTTSCATCWAVRAGAGAVDPVYGVQRITAERWARTWSARSLEDGTRRAYDAFAQCTACARVLLARRAPRPPQFDRRGRDARVRRDRGLRTPRPRERHGAGRRSAGRRGRGSRPGRGHGRREASVAVPGPLRSGSAAGRPLISRSRDCTGPSTTSSPSPTDQSTSVATSRSPRNRRLG